MMMAVISAPIAAENCPAVHTGKIMTKKMLVTAFCPCEKCCGKADFLTTSGHKITKYGEKLLAAPKEYPFKTKMYVPDYGEAPVLTRGGKITGNHIDILIYEKSPSPDMNDLQWSHRQALNWGKQYLDVMIYEN